MDLNYNIEKRKADAANRRKKDITRLERTTIESSTRTKTVTNSSATTPPSTEPVIDTSEFYKIDGERVLTGDMDVGDYNITNVNSISPTLSPTITPSEGDLYWNSDDKTWNIKTDTDTIIQIGQEQLLRIYNDTGVTLNNGEVVYISGADITSGRPTVTLGNATTILTSEHIIGIITSDILDTEQGYATTFGLVRGLDTSGMVAGETVYLSETDGAYTNVRPIFPAWIVEVGHVVTVDATNGVILFHPTVSDNDHFFNGTIIENFDALVTSDGTTITMSLERSGAGDLTMRFSSGYTILDCTPAQTIVLTAGTDTIPQENFVYIPQSTGILTVSTTGWSTAEHIKIAYFFVPSATKVNTDGVYINQNWNNFTASVSTQRGRLELLSEKVRRLGSTYFSGIDPNGATSSYFTIGASTVDWLSTSGIIYQMNAQSVPAYDMSTGDDAHVYNDFTTPYKAIADLFEITAMSDGASLSNNKYFNLVFWMVANKSGEHSPLMINLPSGQYTSESNATIDADKTADYTIPREFNKESSTAFYVCRVTFQFGTTWSVVNVEDLRGRDPLASGGASAGIGQVEFPDSTFRIFNNTDNTKELKIDASGITTGITRTLTIPDASGIIELEGHTHVESEITDLVHWNITDTEGVITAELVDGQSIDNAIDALILTHKGDASAHHTKYLDSEVDAIVATHTAIAGAHHAKYLDSEAVDAIEAVGLATPISTDWMIFSDAGVLKKVVLSGLTSAMLTGLTDNDTTDHTLLSNIGTNSHVTIDSHIADATIHYTQASISITESQISDLQSYSLSTHNHTLDSLSNVTITTIASGELLKWNGVAWINNTLAEAGISAVGHSHVIGDITDFTDNSTNWNTAYGWGDHSLAGYAVDSGVVHITGTETITGAKTFVSSSGLKYSDVGTVNRELRLLTNSVTGYIDMDSAMTHFYFRMAGSAGYGLMENKLEITTNRVKSEVPFYVAGTITVTGTVDGRDVATDGTKLDTITNVGSGIIISATERTALHAEVTSLTKSQVGLGNVDNIADASQVALGTVTSGNIDAIANYIADTWRDVDSTPDSLSPTDSISSQWAYYHITFGTVPNVNHLTDAEHTALHAVYTDAEAISAVEGASPLVFSSDFGQSANYSNLTLQTNETNSSTQRVGVNVRHYTLAEEDIVAWQSYNEGTNSQLKIGGGDATHNAMTEIQFYTAATATTVTGTQRMKIDSTGEVTINTGNLIVGDLGSNGVRYRYNDSYYWDVYRESGGALVWETHQSAANVEMMRLTTSGNLGIGVSPSVALHVGGDLKSIRLSSADYTLFNIGYRGGSGGAEDKAIFQMYDVGVENIRLDTEGDSWLNGGNVGIGDSSPSYKLDVNGTGRFTGLIYANGGHGMLVNKASASNYITIGQTIANWAFLRLAGDGTVNYRWDIAVKSSELSGALQFRPKGAATNYTYMKTNGEWVFAQKIQIGGATIVMPSLQNSAGTYNVRWNSSSKEISYTTSLRETKKNIVDTFIEDNSENIYNLIPYKFDYIGDEGNMSEQIGYMADEVALLLPNMVDIGRWSEEEEIRPMNVRYDKLVIPIISEMKKLKIENEDLRQLIISLMSRVSVLENN